MIFPIKPRYQFSVVLVLYTCLSLMLIDLFRVPASEDLKNSRLFKAFSFNNSRPIQGLLPVDHSKAYNPTGTGQKHTDLKHSCMTFINKKRSKQFFYPLNSNYGRKFSQSPSHQVLLKVSHRQIPNFSRPSTRFPKQFKDIFSFM